MKKKLINFQFFFLLFGKNVTGLKENKYVNAKRKKKKERN